ncbi:ABC transporter ATP-binding protein [Patescibacteria group bacterium]|nr:ABC transporter ATP-binding protein [Patescibacteria group bacterium]
MLKINPIIKTKEASLIYDLGQTYETNALLNVNVEIYPEEYVIIYGPSGCGKSTLLYCMSGLQRLTSGEIIINDKKILSLTNEEVLNINRHEIGMIFQAYHLVPSLSVLDNVILPQIFIEKPMVERNKKAKDLLDYFGILKQASKFPNELSGGQRQRVSIARAMINEPSVIMADEPVGNLDSKSTDVVMGLLEELNTKFKKTIILVTHDDRFLDYAHRVLYMKDGQVVREVINKKSKYKTLAVSEKDPVFGIINRLNKIYPNLSLEELKAKALVEYLLIDFNSVELSRLEKVVAKRISGDISTEVMERILDDSFRNGGVGLYKQTAEDFAQKIDKVLMETDLLKHKIDLRKSEKSEIDLKTEEIRRYLLDNKKTIQITLEQRMKLDQAIKDRLINKINAKVFEKKLDLPLKKGGIGFNSRSAKYFTRELEIILAQE